MKVSALERCAKFFMTPFSLMNITETDESERCLQPMSSSYTINLLMASDYIIFLPHQLPPTP